MADNKEQKCLDCVALTLYQLFSDNFDVNYANRNISMIRIIILYRDKLSNLCKKIGVSANWEMAYVIYAFSDILGTFDTPSIHNEIERLGLESKDLFEYIKQNSCLGGKEEDGFKYILKLYQEWYYGEENYNKYYDDQMSVPGKICVGCE